MSSANNNFFFSGLGLRIYVFIPSLLELREEGRYDKKPIKKA